MYRRTKYEFMIHVCEYGTKNKNMYSSVHILYISSEYMIKL